MTPEDHFHMCRVRKSKIDETFDVAGEINAQVELEINGGDEKSVWILIEGKKTDLTEVIEFDEVRGVATQVVEAWYRIGKPLSTVRNWAYFFEMDAMDGLPTNEAM